MKIHRQTDSQSVSLCCTCECHWSALHLQDAFDALPLGVVAVVAVQLAVRVADELQQTLGLDVHQHRVLQGAAVLRQGLQAALSDPLLRDGRGEKNVSDPQAGKRRQVISHACRRVLPHTGWKVMKQSKGVFFSLPESCWVENVFIFS